MLNMAAILAKALPGRVEVCWPWPMDKRRMMATILRQVMAAACHNAHWARVTR